ncbi:hypothetical protein MHBO_001326 [Bonamia ostreae]|uniref:Phosducin-like protein n=1 Tax=Bonamia ostreae TaxID=126728 RepID=A0ABV2AJT2_9EUKA
MSKNYSSSNTGPKGVKSDYKKFVTKEEQKRKDENKKLFDLLENKPKFVTKLSQKNEQIFINSKRSFGKIFFFQNAKNFVEIVHKDPHSFTLLHLYQNNLEECEKLTKVLSKVSETLTKLRICCIEWHLLLQNIEPKSLPILILFKGDRILKKHEDFDLGLKFDSEDFIDFLEK